jgi:Holliday junction DNA helicase RuvB
VRNQILNNQELPADLNIRPKGLASFVGQTYIIENLKIFIESAKKRSDALDHILFHGPPGLGKTTLAHIIANEMVSKIHVTSGPLLSKAGDLAAILSNLQLNDVLFIDEVHRLSSNIEEILYPAMEDYSLDLIVGDGPAAKTIRISLPKFTLVAATTRIGLISNPLRDRFGIPLRLEFYTLNELEKLLLQTAFKLSIDIKESGAKELAKRSRGTPRIAIRLLRRIRDFLEVSDQKVVDKDFANEVLNKLEIDSFGLDKMDYTYLKFIFENYRDSAVGIKTIASAISEKEDSIEETIEPYLIKIGFIERTPRGRKLTSKATDYLEDN